MPPDRWLVIRVRAASAAARDVLVPGLLELGGSAVQEEADSLTTYLAPPDDPNAFAREAGHRLQALVPDEPVELEWSWRANEDWAREWRRGLEPRRIGQRLIVTPTWAEPEPGAGDIVIRIDPQMAFGTGEHATTRGMLRLLELELRAGDRVLDVGAGSGILAIAAAKLGARGVLAVESDPDAIENATANLEDNGAAGRVELVCALVDDDFLDALGPGRLDLIVANVLSGVLKPLLPAFHRSLAAEGRLLLGGILEDEAEDVLAAADAAGLALRHEDRENGWWGGAFERPPGSRAARAGPEAAPR